MRSIPSLPLAFVLFSPWKHAARLRGKPRYLFQFRVRHSAGLSRTHDVSPLRSISPRDLPSADVTPFHRYYAPSDFLIVVPMASLLPLFIGTPTPGRTARISHAHRSAVAPCRADPEEATRLLPIVKTVVLSSENLTSSTLPE